MRQPMTVEVKEFKLLPCAPDVCQECAVNHPPEMPHNQQSLYWQYKFYETHKRWPTWTDAMAHCTPETKAQWIKAMAQCGVTIPEVKS